MSILNNVQLPPALVAEHNPSTEDQIAQIDRWVLYHLKSTVLSEVHYENQLYGCFNAMLTSIFLSRRRFMVILQAIVRRAMQAQEIEDVNDNACIIWINWCASRIKTSSRSGSFPDFLVVKVKPRPLIEPRHHYIVSAIEIKRDHHTEAEADDKLHGSAGGTSSPRLTCLTKAILFYLAFAKSLSGIGIGHCDFPTITPDWL